MRLILSETETAAISMAHDKARKLAVACAESMEALLELLEQITASLDKPKQEEIAKELQRISSAAFRIKVQKFRVENTGLEGREFTGKHVQPNQL